MKTLPTQERALRKRQALIDAAIAEYSTIGFEIATAKSIAARAGVATGTFYQYFENKNDILCVIASSRFDNLHQRIQLFEPKAVTGSLSNTISVEDQFLETLTFVYEFHAQDPELHQVLEQRRALDQKLQQIMDDGEKGLRQQVLAFVNTFNIDKPELVAESLYAMAEGLVHRLVFHTAITGEPKIKEALAIGANMLASFFIQKQINN